MRPLKPRSSAIQGQELQVQHTIMGKKQYRFETNIQNMLVMLEGNNHLQVIVMDSTPAHNHAFDHNKFGDIRKLIFQKT